MVNQIWNVEEETLKRDRILAGDPQEWATLESYLHLHTLSWIRSSCVDREESINYSIYEAAKRWKPRGAFYKYAKMLAVDRLKGLYSRNKKHKHLPITDTLNIPIEESPDSPCYGLFHNLHGSKVTMEIPEDICLS